MDGHHLLEDVGHVDLYRLLGLNVNCTAEQIRLKYSQLSKIYHPDKTSDEAKKSVHEKIFQQVKLAHKILSNPKLRQEYTCLLQNTYQDLKSDYLLAPKGVEPVEHFDPDLFNRQFGDDVARNRTRQHDEQLDRRPSTVEELLATREECIIPDPRDQVDFDRVGEHLDQVYRRLSEMKSDSSDNGGDGNPDQQKALLFRKSLLGQVKRIRDNLKTDMTVLIDFITLSKQLDQSWTETLEIDSDLVGELQQVLRYEEPEWRKPSREIAAFSFLPGEAGLELEDFGASLI
jgi:curved DNA-binding protein CbpA